VGGGRGGRSSFRFPASLRKTVVRLFERSSGSESESFQSAGLGDAGRSVVVGGGTTMGGIGASFGGAGGA
jgi:hypothetical protein